jgi:hypothetical protein
VLQELLARHRRWKEEHAHPEQPTTGLAPGRAEEGADEELHLPAEDAWVFETVKVAPRSGAGSPGPSAAPAVPASPAAGNANANAKRAEQPDSPADDEEEEENGSMELPDPMGTIKALPALRRPSVVQGAGGERTPDLGSGDVSSEYVNWAGVRRAGSRDSASSPSASATPAEGVRPSPRMGALQQADMQRADSDDNFFPPPSPSPSALMHGEGEGEGYDQGTIKLRPEPSALASGSASLYIPPRKASLVYHMEDFVDDFLGQGTLSTIDTMKSLSTERSKLEGQLPSGNGNGAEAADPTSSSPGLRAEGEEDAHPAARLQTILPPAVDAAAAGQEGSEPLLARGRSPSEPDLGPEGSVDPEEPGDALRVPSPARLDKGTSLTHLVAPVPTTATSTMSSASPHGTYQGAPPGSRPHAGGLAAAHGPLPRGSRVGLNLLARNASATGGAGAAPHGAHELKPLQLAALSGVEGVWEEWAFRLEETSALLHALAAQLPSARVAAAAAAAASASPPPPSHP